MLPEQIKTIKDFGEFSFKEKASEFIAIVYPVDNQESALNHLNEIRKKHYDASHHCYAYKLKNGEEKYFAGYGLNSASGGIFIWLIFFQAARTF